MTSNPYAAQIAATEKANGIPTGLLNQLIATESGYNPAAFNPASGATGIAQILPSTAASPGYGIAPLSNLSDPNASIAFAGQYLAAQYKRTGSWTGAVSAYGTVAPSGPTNPQQASLWQIASNANNAGSGITGGKLINVVGAPPASGGAGTGGAVAQGAPLVPGAGYPLTVGLQSGITSWLGSLASGFADAFKQAISGMLSGLENWITRGFLIFIGVVIVAIALWRLLAPNVSAKDVAMAVAL
jgi:Transglycosylase SLT domain